VVKNRRFRIFVAVAAGLAVLYFGSGGDSAGQDRQISNGVLIWALIAAAAVYHLTRPGDSGTPVS